MFLARYVLLIEIVGFISVGVLLAGVTLSIFYRLDDVCKVNSLDAVAPHVEAVTPPGRSYVESVGAEYGDEVVEGQPILVVSCLPHDVKASVAASSKTAASRFAVWFISRSPLSRRHVACFPPAQRAPVHLDGSSPG